MTISEIKNFIHRYGIAEDDLCPCGSGDSYGRCCLKKSKIKEKSNILQWMAEASQDIWDNDSLSSKRCSYNGCSCAGIGSHSIQRGKHLKLIEPIDDNYLIRVCKVMKNGGFKPYPRREYKNQATTFYGFCGVDGNNHDRKIFENIEVFPIIYSKEQVYSLVYRSVAYMHDKMSRLNKFNIYHMVMQTPEVLLNVPQKNDVQCEGQVKSIAAYRQGIYKEEYYRSYMDELEKNISTNSAGEISWLITNDILNISKVRKIAVNYQGFTAHSTRTQYNDFINAPYDLESRAKDTSNNLMTYYVLPNEAGNDMDVFCVAKKCSDTNIADFIQNFSQFEDKEIRNVACNLIFDSLEEVYFSQKYFKSITDADKNLLYEQVRKKNDVFFDELTNNPIIDFFKYLV